MGGESFTAVGRIVKTHGLKGEVSVKAYAEASLELLTGIEVWLVPPPRGLRTSEVLGVRPGPKGPILQLAGVDDIDAATQLSGCELLVPTDRLPDDWFQQPDSDDAVGMRVVDEERGFLGMVEEVIVTGANDVWVVEGPLGEVLIPVIDDVLLGYDEDSDTATVRLLPGLLEGEGEDQ